MFNNYKRFLSVLPDGRTSLKHKLSSFNYKSFKNNWLSDPSTYPIIGVITCATTMLTGVSLYFLLYEPDVSFNKDKRSEIIKTNFEEGFKWENSGLKKFFKGKDPSHISIFHPLKTMFDDKKN